MKCVKYLDIIIIIFFCILLCGFVSLRIITKEILIDRLEIEVPGSHYILYDLNTTVELSGAGKEPNSSYEVLMKKYCHKLEAYTTSAMIFNQQINTIVQWLDKQLLNIPATFANIGYIDAPFREVNNFATYLADKEIPFMYVATPLQDSILSRRGEKELYANRLNECHWYLLRSLNNAGIDALDLAQELASADVGGYDNSNHWFPECALYATKVLAAKLNSYGFEFDTDKFDINNTWDFLEDEQKFVAEINQEYGYNFSIPVPDWVENMEFSVEHAGLGWSGKYEDVFLQIPDSIDGAYHDCIRIKNETWYQFHNLNSENNRQKKILIIGDSFNWILSAYLIADIEYIDVIYNASFSGSIRRYIEETEPDMVLIIYNDAELSETYTKEAYNLE